MLIRGAVVLPLEGVQVNERLHITEEPIEILDQEIKQLRRSKIAIVKTWSWDYSRTTDCHKRKATQEWTHPLFTDEYRVHVIICGTTHVGFSPTAEVVQRLHMWGFSPTAEVVRENALPMLFATTSEVDRWCKAVTPRVSALSGCYISQAQMNQILQESTMENVETTQGAEALLTGFHDRDTIGQIYEKMQ
ncbi:hypothetical protein OSB04_024044 [Centaurea solstitialis]|uniref:Uncharacterized protein n=1 Tax=Centaurea solstitialis TaxID=347529 RepID=A0AA38W2S8_9ASTR|nr:hypothetical protein OSB04_024044 [Centaurea solstitialis]